MEEAPALGRVQSALAGRYTIEREVGRGGWATVYLATELKHDRQVALKVLHPELSAALGADRFLREISVTAHLAHPHILPLHDSGEAEGLLYYVMPYVEGESLRDRLRREKQLPLDDALEIAREVADALQYAHGHGVIHRDIKPENILLEGAHAVIADFGIARAVSAAAGTKLTDSGLALGTPAYMSPEQATGDQTIDERSDVYSLGCVLYEMLSGETPYGGPTPQVILAKKLNEPLPRISVVRETVPPGIEAALAKALARSPADRFKTAAEFAAVLAHPGTAGAALAAPAARQVSWRRRLLPFGLVAAALLAVAIAVALRHQRARPGASGLGRIVVSPLENRTGTPALDVVGLMASDWITEGLQKTGIVDVVPTSTAIAAYRYASAGANRNREPLRALASETGAGTVITGSFYRQGDRLLFRVDLADRGGTRVVATLADVEAPASSPLRAAEELRARLMGWLAVHYDERLAPAGSAGERPPTYEAYQAFSEGMSRYTAADDSQAVTLFLRAYQLDSSFTAALLYASIALTNLGNWARADSLLGVVDRHRKDLSEYDQAWLDYRLGFIHGDDEAALAAIRTAAKLAPESKAAYNHAVEAYYGGYLREALAAMEALPSDRGPMRGYSAYWDIYGVILHALGDYGREYKIELAARAMYPDRLLRVMALARALVATGRLSAVAPTLRAAEGMPPGMQGWDYGNVLEETAEELRAHGHPDLSAGYFEQLRTWLVAHDAGPTWKWRLVTALYALGRWDEAGAALAQLRPLDPGSTDYLGMAGLLLARRGLGSGAMAVADSLARTQRPYDHGTAFLYCARIAAVLGDRAGAVARLREALARGVGYDLWIHREMDLEPLRGYAPFEQLKRGKD